MNRDDEEIFRGFLEESNEHLATIEEDIVALESQGSNLNEDLINKVFRAIHTIKGSAGFFSLQNIKELAHAMENLLGKIRAHEMIFSSQCATLLLEGTDLLKSMLNNTDEITSYNTAPLVAEITNLLTSGQTPADSTQNLFTKEQINSLQKQEKSGRFNYILEWQLGNDGTTGASLQNTIMEIIQFGALGQPVIQTSTKESFFNRTARIWFPYSTVIEPELFYDLIKLPKDCITLLTENKEEAHQLPTPLPTPKISSSFDKNVPSENHFKSKPESSSIRVNLDQLDKLMTLAGELVLARNALIRKTNDHSVPQLSSITQQIDNITSEVQEAIMATRMQSVGTIFTKFKRIVRDLSRSLNKNIELSIEGEDVELDKTIIEALNDPLTHLVRNSADHGIEPPDKRVLKGKAEAGLLSLKARHEAGHVIIEICDDGAGIDPDRIRSIALEKKLISKEDAAALSDKEALRLIFKPGFSTSEKVTEISGRGVGMDVVLSNITKVGGAVDIKSKIDNGTIISLKLPLTLAIIPSILVSVKKQRFAIPQLNVIELLRIPAQDVKTRIEKIGESAVIRLRGLLVPLVYLTDIFSIERTYRNPDTGVQNQERRTHIADRRSHSISPEESVSEPVHDIRSGFDRRRSRESAVNIVIVTSGVQQFGLVIDQFLDSEEIVVKPIGSHLKECIEYAGATILGDGSVALILNIAGISSSANLSQMQHDIETIESRKRNSIELNRDSQTYLIVKNNAEEQLAIPLGSISRIGRFKENSIISIAGQQAITYNDSTLALLSIENVLNTKPRTIGSDVYVIIFKSYGYDAGIMVSQIVDIIDLSSAIDSSTYVKPGVLGSVIISGKITLILDLHAFVDICLPEYKKNVKKAINCNSKILIVEDSPFFLRQLKTILTENELEVVTATNGQEGIEELEKNADSIGLCLTDIEMPVMNGIEMAKEIRADMRFQKLPIIAITTLSGDNAEKKARDAGISEYLVKLDREQIIDRCNYYLHQKRES